MMLIDEVPKREAPLKERKTYRQDALAGVKGEVRELLISRLAAASCGAKLLYTTAAMMSGRKGPDEQVNMVNIGVTAILYIIQAMDSQPSLKPENVVGILDMVTALYEERETRVIASEKAGQLHDSVEELLKSFLRDFPGFGLGGPKGG